MLTTELRVLFPPMGRILTIRPLLSVKERVISVQALSWVFEHSDSRLGARHVLLSIANHAKSDGTGSWPSVDTISRESKVSEREVRYALRELEKSGELRTSMRNGPRGCNLYSLPLMSKSKQEQGQTLQGQKPTQGGQNPAARVSDFAPEPSLNRPLKQPSNTEKPARTHTPDKIRQIEAKQKRLQDEAEVARELYVGAGPMCADRNLIGQIRAIAERKRL